jgi:hypothetical protein
MAFTPVIPATGTGFTVSCTLAVALQPFTSVTVTVYIPAVPTTMVAVVCTGTVLHT